MDAEFSEDQELLRATVRRFLTEQAPVRPYVRAMLDDARGYDDAVWQGLADLGAMGLAVPEEHGGTGGGMIDLGVVLEELGRAVHPGPFLSSAVGAVDLVVHTATPAMQAELLPGLADGTSVGTIALPPAAAVPPFDATSLGAPGWRLSGRATWVADAATADTILTVATTDAGPRAFAVGTDQPGVRIDPIDTIDGTRRFADVHLVAATATPLDVNLDPEAAVARTRDLVNIALVVDGIGTAEAALELAVAYAKERRQFDVPIGSFQAVQHLCADMLRELETARAGAYYALWAADAAPPEERHRAATMTKAYAAEALPAIGASLIQILGGIGFTWEHDAHLYYKRLLTLQQIGGSAAEHLEELAVLVLDA